MGYQALLFCPDEKTARTVTQVLSELNFSVMPCTEPFAAVKKLMGEHFDAVVVDCDNEQNATLLFKSARNTSNNQQSLAVAVVEGQAGVAKAFRIGANLVLTKPINVEQAKGTLRVGRGLLRKSEAAKPATAAASTAVKPAVPVPTTPKPAPQATSPSVATTRPAAPDAPLVTAVTASIPPQKAAPQPRIVASVPAGITETDAEPLEITSEEIASAPIAKPAAQASAPKIISAAPSPAAAETRIETAVSRPEVLAPTPSVSHSARFGTSAASAPAPAREPKPSVSTEDKPSTGVSEQESPVEKVAANENSSSVEETSYPAPAFTFGGTVSSGAESAGGGSKKALLAVAAVVLIAAGGYEAWMQWVRSSGAATGPTHVAAQPVTTKASVPQGGPSAAPVGTSSAARSATSSVQSSTSDSAAAPQPTGIAKTSSAMQATASTENARTHPSKVSAGADSSKPAASALAANKGRATKAAAQPIVIKKDLSQPAGKPAATTDAPAPSLAAIAPGNSGALPNLMGQSKAPTPVLQTLTVSQGVSQGLLLKKAQPAYPASAMRMHVEGAVQLMATVAKNGDVSAVKILSGDASLAHAAADAVKRWKYKPYLLNGEPVEIQTQVTVNFKLPK